MSEFDVKVGRAALEDALFARDVDEYEIQRRARRRRMFIIVGVVVGSVIFGSLAVLSLYFMFRSSVVQVAADGRGPMIEEAPKAGTILSKNAISAPPRKAMEIVQYFRSIPPWIFISSAFVLAAFIASVIVAFYFILTSKEESAIILAGKAASPLEKPFYMSSFLLGMNPHKRYLKIKLVLLSLFLFFLFLFFQQIYRRTCRQLKVNVTMPDGSIHCFSIPYTQYDTPVQNLCERLQPNPYLHFFAGLPRCPLDMDTTLSELAHDLGPTIDLQAYNVKVTLRPREQPRASERLTNLQEIIRNTDRRYYGPDGADSMAYIRRIIDATDRHRQIHLELYWEPRGSICCTKYVNNQYAGTSFFTLGAEEHPITIADITERMEGVDGTRLKAMTSARMPIKPNVPLSHYFGETDKWNLNFDYQSPEPTIPIGSLD